MEARRAFHRRARSTSVRRGARRVTAIQEPGSATRRIVWGTSAGSAPDWESRETDWVGRANSRAMAGAELRSGSSSVRSALAARVWARVSAILSAWVADLAPAIT